MAKFMFLQRGGCDSPPEMTPEQMEQGMKAWMDWVKSGTEEGWLLDPGSGLGSGAVVNASRSINYPDAPDGDWQAAVARAAKAAQEDLRDAGIPA